MVESIKNFFLKFISGRLGLLITFWIFGVLIALILDFLTSQAVELWQVITLAIVSFLHFILIVIAVWNASTLYTDNKLWVWLSRVVVVLNIIKWLWYLPLLISTISNALELPLNSDSYWELNARKFVCESVDYSRTPEILAKEYHCATSTNPNSELIAMRCENEGNVGDFIFTKNEQDCLKYLAKLKALGFKAN